MKRFLLFSIFMCLGLAVFAQDKIYMNSGKTIECKVTEVGTEEIKYLRTETGDVVYTVKRIDVSKIEFENGHVERFREEMEDPDLYNQQRGRAIKFEFISPLLGYTHLSYEQAIKPGMSWEAGFGLIGLGQDIENNMPRGAHIKGGLRFLKTPDFKSGSLRYWHRLKGIYVKPELAFGVFARDVEIYTYTPGWPYTSTYEKKRETVTYGTVQIQVGKQHVFADAFLIDYYAGVGYGFADHSETEQGDSRYYGAIITNRRMPLSYSLGLKIGFLFK